MPFPVFKLAYLAIRQISKPLAAIMKHRAKTSPLMHKVIVPIGQLYHSVETRSKLRLLGLTQRKKVTPLSDEMAVELGADILGEVIIYTVAALTICAEYFRQSRKDRYHESSQEKRINELLRTVHELDFRVDQQRAEIAALTRELYHQLDVMSYKIDKKLATPSIIRDPKSGIQLNVKKS